MQSELPSDIFSQKKKKKKDENISLYVVSS